MNILNKIHNKSRNLRLEKNPKHHYRLNQKSPYNKMNWMEKGACDFSNKHNLNMLAGDLNECDMLLEDMI